AKKGKKSLAKEHPDRLAGDPPLCRNRLRSTRARYRLRPDELPQRPPALLPIATASRRAAEELRPARFAIQPRRRNGPKPTEHASSLSRSVLRVAEPHLARQLWEHRRLGERRQLRALRDRTCGLPAGNHYPRKLRPGRAVRNDARRAWPGEVSIRLR